MGHLIKVFFGLIVHDFSIGGAVLRTPSGPSCRLFAQLGMVLQDGARTAVPTNEFGTVRVMLAPSRARSALTCTAKSPISSVRTARLGLAKAN